MAGRCEAIVTGDRDLLDLGTYKDTAIVSARRFSQPSAVTATESSWRMPNSPGM
jgi:predicted nucleic acid-binding protein